MTLDLIDCPSPNHDQREGRIDMLVLHYTGMQTGAAALERLRDPQTRVSSHYLVEEDGRIFCLVREDRRAWHAGVSEWGGRAQLNDCSIGIEIVNPGHEWGYRAFPEAQMQAVESLVGDIVRRRGIVPERVLGHSDIAPMRKEDPGELFDWQRLARAGLVIWPQAATDTAPGRLLDPEGSAALTKMLAQIGYGTESFARTLTAFRRRFRPDALDGPPVMRDFLIAREVASQNPAAEDRPPPISTPEFTPQA